MFSLENAHLESIGKKEPTTSFIKRNQTLASNYKAYKEQRIQIMSMINQRNHEQVRDLGEQIALQKLEYNQFSMKKWDIKRQLVNKLFDVICDRKRSQILQQFWIVTVKQFWVLKCAAESHELRCYEREQQALRNMRARTIQICWSQFALKFGMNESVRVQNHLKQMFTIRGQSIHRPMAARAKNMLKIFLKDFAKSKLFQ